MFPQQCILVCPRLKVWLPFGRNCRSEIIFHYVILSRSIFFFGLYSNLSLLSEDRRADSIASLSLIYSRHCMGD